MQRESVKIVFVILIFNCLITSFLYFTISRKFSSETKNIEMNDNVLQNKLNTITNLQKENLNEMQKRIELKKKYTKILHNLKNLKQEKEKERKKFENLLKQKQEVLKTFSNSKENLLQKEKVIIENFEKTKKDLTLNLKENEKFQNKIKQNDKIVEEMKVSNKNLENEIKTLKDLLDSQKNQIKTLTTRSEESIKKLKDELSKKNSKIEELTNLEKQIEKEKKNFEDNYNDDEKKLKDFYKIQASLKAENLNLKNEYAAMKLKVDSMTQDLKSKEFKNYIPLIKSSLPISNPNRRKLINEECLSDNLEEHFKKTKEILKNCQYAKNGGSIYNQTYSDGFTIPYQDSFQIFLEFIYCGIPMSFIRYFTFKITLQDMEMENTFFLMDWR
jgi:chromosome segregation ATPase